MPSEVIIIVIELMFLGVNIFLSLSRAKKIFTPANINSIVKFYSINSQLNRLIYWRLDLPPPPSPPSLQGSLGMSARTTGGAWERARSTTTLKMRAVTKFIIRKRTDAQKTESRASFVFDSRH